MSTPMHDAFFPQAQTFDHIMIDLETMGTGPDAAIIQIGAVAFHGPLIAQEFAGLENTISAPLFHTHVNLQSCLDAGLRMDASTVLWWLEQDDAARKAAARSGPGAVPLEEALLQHADFVRLHSDPKHTQVWSNGSDFDLVILSTAYRLLHIDRPWPYWASRCFRTEKNRRRDIAGREPTIKHHALADAIAQAEHLRAIQAADLRDKAAASTQA